MRLAHYEFPESIHLTNGYIEFQGDIKVAEEITALLLINGHEMAATMLEGSARQAGFKFNTHYGNTMSANGPVSIENITLASGIVVSNISAEIDIENPAAFELNNLVANVFDGQASLTAFSFADNRIGNTSIHLKHINLEQLLEFADLDGLEGTGMLDITLPAGGDENGIYIKDGTFQSTVPGHIAYLKEGMAGSNIGLQALENFQYKDLSGTIDYQSDGTYIIVVHLVGKNPDLYGGHPIKFNLSINGSLPRIFKSLFITGDFEEAIIQQIKTN
jgi:hypothetical protein